MAPLKLMDRGGMPWWIAPPFLVIYLAVITALTRVRAQFGPPAAGLLLAAPFVPALTWAFALAVVADPLHFWIRARLTRPALAAILTVVLVAIMLLAPTVVIVWQVSQQASDRFDEVVRFVDSGTIREKIDRLPGAR